MLSQLPKILLEMVDYSCVGLFLIRNLDALRGACHNINYILEL